MNYLLYSGEDFLLTEELNKIIKKYNIEELSINRYDLELDNIKTIIDDCQTISFFEEKKLIVVNNCNFFNRVKSNNDDIDLLLEYLEHYNPNTILVILVHNESIDNTKKITKKIKEIGKILSLSSTNINNIVKSMFDDYKISKENITLLIERVGEDISILSQEVEKLKCYKFDEKEILKEDIINCSTFNIDTDIFKFIDNIIMKRKEQALNTYYELLKNNEEPIKIIALLASKFRLMYQVSILNKKGMSNNEIANLLGVHAYPVKLAIQSGMRYSERLLLSFLHKLADLDNDIKTGVINAELGLELFILKV